MIRFSVIGFVVLLAANGIFAGPQQGFGPGDQDWGHVTVRPGAHMFWWLYYTTAPVRNYTERPLVLWLQGGPGASSSGYGNFEELGPLDLFLNERNFTWVKNYNVMFIDNPVGTGYSYVDDTKLLTKTNKEIAKDLVALLHGFYKHSPEFLKVPLHIQSESYGGKMAAEFAYELQKEIDEGLIKCNLVSVGMVDPWISPIDSVLSWGPFLLNSGHADEDGYQKIQASALKTKQKVDAGKWVEATNLWGITEVVIMEETDGVDFYNILKPIYQPIVQRKIEKHRKGRFIGGNLRDITNFEEDRDETLNILMNTKVKEALRLPGKVIWGGQKNSVWRSMEGDFMKDCLDIMVKLVDETNVTVAVITGQLDLICATPGTVEWVNKMEWKGLPGYLKSKRTSVVVNDYIEGYQRSYRNFALYWASRSGHMVPADNPKLMDYVLTELTGIEPKY